MKLTVFAFLFFQSCVALAVNLATYSYPANRQLAIDPVKMADCLALKSIQLKQKVYVDRNQMVQPFDSNKFFYYLVADPRREFDYQSGTEKKLFQWILNQKDNSLDPLALFNHSLQMNQGNLWNAILAIHEVLRDNARFFSKKFYRLEYDINQKNSAQLFNKLIDIRGDLIERDPKIFHGDHRGTWYRIWGIMLYRLMVESDSDLNNQFQVHQNDYSELNQKFNDLQSWINASGAEWVKYFSQGTGKNNHPIDDTRKIIYNRLGYLTLSNYINVMSHVEYLGGNVFENLKKSCNARFYLVEDPEALTPQ
jgi:hypothetical protein